MGLVFYPRCRAILSVLLDQRDGGIGETVPTFTVIPRSIVISQNNHRAADTFHLELDYRDFPIDPRAVRAIQVAIHLGDTGDALKELDLSRETLRFFGFADEPETTLTSSGEVVRLSGRDFTGIFLDYTWPGTAINVARPLADVVQEIVDTVPAAEGINVFFPDGVSQFVVVAARLGRDRYSPESNDDAWTVLSSICALAGLVPVMVQDDLQVRSATTVQDTVATMLYGHNISSLTYRRKLNENASKQIKVVCWDPILVEAREGIFPPQPLIVRKRILKSGKVKTEAAPIVTYHVEGSYTDLDLALLAQSIFTEGSREQIEGEFETKDLTDISGVVDLTQLNNGDIINLQIGKESLASIQSLSLAEAVRLLTQGPDRLDPIVAAALVSVWRSVESAATQFYVKLATHRWDREKGYSLVVKFINLV